MPERLQVPPELRRAVEAELRPVRPLREPWRRALAFLPAGALLLAGVPWVFGLRGDAGRLGAILLWGVSCAQVFLGMALIGVGLREAVPARSVTRPALLLLLGAAAGWVALATALTASQSPTRAPLDQELFFWKVCFGLPTLIGVPLVALAGWLAARGLPLRPELTGALCGAGCGLLVDAGWRLFCHVSAPGHVLLAHGASVLALAGLGAVAGRLWERIERNRGRRR